MGHTEYFISTGKENKFFTLWYSQTYMTTYGQRDILYFVQNLSIDYKTAIEKAKEIANGAELCVEVGENHPLNKRGLKASKEVFDGKTLTWGRKFNGMDIEDVLDDEFGIKYIALGYGFPSKPRQCDLDCLAYTSNHPRVKKYIDRITKIEDDRKKLTKRLISEIKESSYVGEIGEKIERTVLVTKFFNVESFYGTSTCFKMVDDENNRFCVFTNSNKFFSVGKDAFENNKSITVSGIVKKHEERDENFKIENDTIVVDNVRQTLLTRIKAVGN